MTRSEVDGGSEGVFCGCRWSVCPETRSERVVKGSQAVAQEPTLVPLLWVVCGHAMSAKSDCVWDCRHRFRLTELLAGSHRYAP